MPIIMLPPPLTTLTSKHKKQGGMTKLFYFTLQAHFNVIIILCKIVGK